MMFEFKVDYVTYKVTIRVIGKSNVVLMVYKVLETYDYLICQLNCYKDKTKWEYKRKKLNPPKHEWSYYEKKVLVHENIVEPLEKYLVDYYLEKHLLGS